MHFTEFALKSRDYYRENAVVVTRWVNIDGSSLLDWRDGQQTVLLEVLLWRG